MYQNVTFCEPKVTLLLQVTPSKKHWRLSGVWLVYTTFCSLFVISAARNYVRTFIYEPLSGCKFQVPGQRVLALHLLASVLNRASSCILQNPVGATWKISNTERLVDWEAIWAFILGPEPELAFSLRRVSTSSFLSLFYFQGFSIITSVMTTSCIFKGILITILYRKICFLCSLSLHSVCLKFLVDCI